MNNDAEYFCGNCANDCVGKPFRKPYTTLYCLRFKHKTETPEKGMPLEDFLKMVFLDKRGRISVIVHVDKRGNVCGNDSFAATVKVCNF